MSAPADAVQLSKLCCATYRLAAENSAILTDAFVLANHASQAVFDAAVGNLGAGIHADSLRVVSQLQRAFRYDGDTYGLGDVTDSNLSGLSTVAGLEALTSGANDVSRAFVIQ